MALFYDLPKYDVETAETIVSCVRKYMSLIGLDSWQVKVEFTVPDEVEDVVPAATCLPSAEYFMAELGFDLDYFRRHPDQTEGYVRHELLHCIVRPLAQTAWNLGAEEKTIRFFEELVTSQLDRMPVWDIVESEEE